MKKNLKTSSQNVTLRTAWYAVLFTLAVASPDVLATGGAGGSFTDTGETVCGFFTNINGLLNIASVAVVTIAVIFAGYQIAFAHKRIADVAPILIGGVLIGAASQIAKMLLGDDAGGSCSTSVSALWHAATVLSV